MAKKKLTADTLQPFGHHFLMVSAGEWKASHDVSACLARGMSSGLAFTLYMVPRPMAAHDQIDYAIQWFKPVVDGCVVLNTFGYDQYYEKSNAAAADLAGSDIEGGTA